MDEVDEAQFARAVAVGAVIDRRGARIDAQLIPRVTMYRMPSRPQVDNVADRYSIGARTGYLAFRGAPDKRGVAGSNPAPSPTT